MKNTPQECAKTSAFTFGACHFLFDMLWVIEEDETRLLLRYHDDL